MVTWTSSIGSGSAGGPRSARVVWRVVGAAGLAGLPAGGEEPREGQQDGERAWHEEGLLLRSRLALRSGGR